MCWHALGSHTWLKQPQMGLYTAASHHPQVERAVYSLGSPRGRAVLHLIGLFMLLPWVLSQFWGLTSHVAKLHLRVFTLLRVSSLCFGEVKSIIFDGA